MNKIFTRCGSNRTGGGGALCPHPHQGNQGDGGVPGVGAGDYQVSDQGVPGWLCEQEISGAGAGLLSLCSSLHQISLSTGGFIQKELLEIFHYIARPRSAPANSWTVWPVWWWTQRTVWNSAREPFLMLSQRTMLRTKMDWSRCWRIMNYLNWQGRI